jgi:hypothetical protein
VEADQDEALACAADAGEDHAGKRDLKSLTSVRVPTNRRMPIGRGSQQNRRRMHREPLVTATVLQTTRTPAGLLASRKTTGTFDPRSVQTVPNGRTSDRQASARPMAAHRMATAAGSAHPASAGRVAAE